MDNKLIRTPSKTPIPTNSIIYRKINELQNELERKFKELNEKIQGLSQRIEKLQQSLVVKETMPDAEPPRHGKW